MVAANAQGEVPRSNTTIACYGDSWTYGNSIGLSNVLRAQGLSGVTVAQRDLWGSTAEYFASNTNLLPDFVKAKKADYVLLSLGGNDFKNFYWRRRQFVSPGTALKQVEEHLRKVLDVLYAQHPNVHVVMYGYDFPGPVDDYPDAFLAGQSAFSARAAKLAYQWLGLPFINKCVMKLGDTLQTLSKEYTAKGCHFKYIPLWGTLQQEGAKQKGEAVGFDYQLTKPSPAEYMNDPIHANEKGYTALMTRLFDQYFATELAR